MLKIGDKVTVLFPVAEQGAQGEIVSAFQGQHADWNVEISVGSFAHAEMKGFTFTYRDQDLALEARPQPTLHAVPDPAPVEPERHWFHDETFVDAVVTGWIDKLAGSLDDMANAIHRLADAQEKHNKLL